MADEVFFTGEIVSVFFSNPANFYKVFLLQITDTDSDYGDSEITVTGTIGDVAEGEHYRFFGTLTTHPKYGEQLAATRYEKERNNTVAGLIKYFSSKHFPGIGKAMAEKIVEAYPERTIDTILDHPEKLEDLLSIAKRVSFLKRLRAGTGEDRLLADLSKYGLPAAVNLRIIEAYHEEALELIATEPYRLVEEIRGVGFKLADKMALEAGIAADAPGRIRAGLLHVVSTRAMATGDTYILREDLLALTEALLTEARAVAIATELMADELSRLLADGHLQGVEDRIFEASLYKAEVNIYTSVSQLMKGDATALVGATEPELSADKIAAAIAQSEEALDIRYDRSQQEAIEKAMTHGFSLLTGGPGTGKTTIIEGIIRTYATLHELDLDPDHYNNEIFPILLAAPTGRAARRMNEVTQLPAATLHRHLGIATDDNASDPANDLSGRLLIVDEFSMVDTWLAAKLFAAIPAGMKVVLVGDADQLPSVSPGQVFTDLFKLPEVAATRLTRIYRQSADSTITQLADSIKKGQLTADLTVRQADRTFFAADSGQIPHLIGQIAQSWLHRGNDPFELQVLAPMYKGMAGIDHLNTVLQEIFNPLADRVEFAFKQLHFRAGDKVLHLVNDAETGVFNGDLGRVTDLVAAKYTESKQDELVMDFDGIEVTYPRAEWYKLTLAYAMSIHKAQGSEFQTVVLPLVTGFSRMLERNLLYTAVTRAKKSLILLGELRAFETAVSRVGSNRKTYLVERFSQSVEAATEVPSRDERSVELATGAPSRDEESVEVATGPLSRDRIEAGDIDPLIGLTENDFAIFKQ